MNLNNILGKTVSITYGNKSFEAVLIECTIWGDITVMRSDNGGWHDTEYEAKAKALGFVLPNPTFWYVAEREIDGVMVPVTQMVLKPLSEVVQAATVQAPAAVPAIPTTPIEPTAPMTAQVLQMLRKKGDVTSIEAQGVLRCRSLSKRITELKRLGHKITRTLHEDHTGQRYARYILAA